MKRGLEEVMVAGVRAVYFEDRGRSHEPRSVSVSRSWRRKGGKFSLKVLERKRPADILNLAQKDPYLDF